MSEIMNAGKFIGSEDFQRSQFDGVLKCCVSIYKGVLSKKAQIENNEEKIRDLFFYYLKDNTYREKNAPLENFLFDREVSENDGYVDIKAVSHDTFRDTAAYFIIECKRLDSKRLNVSTGLNAEYVKNGICRFVSEYYSSYYDCNAMFGFIVENVNVQVDIIDNMNSMLKKNLINKKGKQVNAHATQPIKYEDFADGYPYSYVSKHTCTSGKGLTLYHLLFDFSSNII